MFNWFKKRSNTSPRDAEKISITIPGVDPRTDNEFRFFEFVEREKPWRLEGWYKEIKSRNIPVKKQYEAAIKDKIQKRVFTNPHKFPDYFNNEFDYIAIDFETANNSRVSACALGLVFIKDYKVAHKIKFMIKPPKGEKFRSFHTQLHGISSDDVAYADTFDVIWQKELSKYLTRNLVICHHHSSDIGSLKKLCEYYDLEDFKVKYFDTEEIAKKCGLPGRLKELTKELGISFQDNHDPVADAFACGEVFNELKEKYPAYDELLKEVNNKTVKKEVEKAQAKTALDNSNLDIIQKYSVAEEDVKDFSFTSKGFLFTGDHIMPRDFYEEKVKKLGGVVKKGVSGNVDFVVIGTNFGWAKIQKVHDLNSGRGCNIKVLSEKNFLMILDNKNNEV